MINSKRGLCICRTFLLVLNVCFSWKEERLFLFLMKLLLSLPLSVLGCTLYNFVGKLYGPCMYVVVELFDMLC